MSGEGFGLDDAAAGAGFMAEVRVDLPDAARTQALGEALAGVLAPGDLVILTGDLGAGKTTFTQGLGRGLNVRGQVSSPTFIVAREHAPLPRPDGTRGPGLVHVDAYRLGGLGELDALDLDSALEDCVVVVEWGLGLAETLTEDRLEVDLVRPRGGSIDVEDPEAGVRHATLRGVGARWANVDLAALAASVAV